MDMANYSASKRPQDSSFPLSPAKRRRIGSSQQPSYFLPQPPLPSPLRPSPTHGPTPSRPMGRPRRQSTPVTTPSRLRGPSPAKPSPHQNSPSPTVFYIYHLPPPHHRIFSLRRPSNPALIAMQIVCCLSVLFIC